MVRLVELTVERQREWDAWIQSRPPIIQEMVTKTPPGRLYRYRSTGQRGMIYSYTEDGCVTVIFPQEYNPWQNENRQVHGIDPQFLQECDFPTAEQMASDKGDEDAQSRSPCEDCGLDVLDIHEHYMVRNALWNKVSGGAKYLCIGCLEKRLGRELAQKDFSDAPINNPYHPLNFGTMSDRLLNRLTRE
jgi:hypothetical protein